jgi:hypothetical protein
MSHHKLGLPCQDAHGWKVLENGLLVAAVADGAGSAPLADAGASIAASHATKELAGELNGVSNPSELDNERWEKLLLETAARARARLESEANDRSVSMSDLATTLIVAVVGVSFVAAAQVGDGAIVVALCDDALICLGRPPIGEYLNETSFLTSGTALAQIQPVIWRGDLKAVAMFSDGLQMAALRMPEGEPHPGFFLPLIGFAEGQANAAEARAGLVSFLESPRLRERTDDDVTLLLATKG